MDFLHSDINNVLPLLSKPNDSIKSGKFLMIKIISCSEYFLRFSQQKYSLLIDTQQPYGNFSKYLNCDRELLIKTIDVHIGGKFDKCCVSSVKNMICSQFSGILLKFLSWLE
jgi:hypothetical protein